jgi:hypothetical protein
MDSRPFESRPFKLNAAMQRKPATAMHYHNLKPSFSKPEDNERKLISISQHPLWIECLCSWWQLFTGKLKTEDFSLCPEQYVDLHVSIQKVLLQDFDFDEACSQAWADWSQEIAGDGAVPWTFNFEQFNEFMIDTVSDVTPTIQAASHLFALGALLLTVRCSKGV